ncbi:hypothetical protein [Sediminitomix flava]|uniref:Uncharacterized protein n=1 Tax=Sediminitomix flava TaxID=379075 RepID=A0A315ZCY0_SEDFL|nr:hypothetical protein [Sediminitomix flava]PWJ42688.1 hypothetical protein BC781_102233 [Sediminitomix flava]
MENQPTDVSGSHISNGTYSLQCYQFGYYIGCVDNKLQGFANTPTPDQQIVLSLASQTPSNGYWWYMVKNAEGLYLQPDLTFSMERQRSWGFSFLLDDPWVVAMAVSIQGTMTTLDMNEAYQLGFHLPSDKSGVSQTIGIIK